MWCCTRDEGGPLEVGSQVRASNHCKLRSSKAVGGERCRKAETRFRQVWFGEASASEPSMKCRNALTDVETGGGRFLRDKRRSGPGGCLCGIRHLGGANSDQALVWNVRTCRPDAKGDVQATKSARTRVPMRDTGAEWSVVGTKVL